MKTKGLYLNAENKRMTKGMRVNSLPVQALLFDATHPEFTDIESITAAAVAVSGSPEAE
jgi:hypothetical protein